jgi:1-deoxy-D-xylulose-5-phosphate reductoisomerase
MKRLFERFDFKAYERLEFFEPDQEKFPCLGLAIEALKKGGSLPCFMSAANEVLVHRFSVGEISWQMIGQKLGDLMKGHNVLPAFSFEELFFADSEGREAASKV